MVIESGKCNKFDRLQRFVSDSKYYTIFYWWPICSKYIYKIYFFKKWTDIYLRNEQHICTEFSPIYNHIGIIITQVKSTIVIAVPYINFLYAKNLYDKSYRPLGGTTQVVHNIHLYGNRFVRMYYCTYYW